MVSEIFIYDALESYYLQKDHSFVYVPSEVKIFADIPPGWTHIPLLDYDRDQEHTRVNIGPSQRFSFHNIEAEYLVVCKNWVK